MGLNLADERSSREAQPVARPGIAHGRPARDLDFRRLLDSSAAAHLVLGADHRLRYVNAVAASALGAPADQLVGVDPFPFIHPDDLADVLERLTTEAPPGERDRMRLRIRRPDGAVTCWMGRADTDDAGNRYVFADQVPDHPELRRHLDGRDAADRFLRALSRALVPGHDPSGDQLAHGLEMVGSFLGAISGVVTRIDATSATATRLAVWTRHGLARVRQRPAPAPVPDAGWFFDRMERGEVVIERVADLPADFRGAVETLTDGQAAWLVCLPLMNGADAVGAVVVATVDPPTAERRGVLSVAADMLAGALAWTDASRAMTARARSETRISELVRRLNRVRPAHVEHAVDDALRDIGQVLGATETHLLIGPTPASASRERVWTRRGTVGSRAAPTEAARFELLADLDDDVHCLHIDDVPDGSAEARWLRGHGVESLAVSVLKVGSTTVGWLAVFTDTARSWTEAERTMVAVTGESIANAVNRAQARAELESQLMAANQRADDVEAVNTRLREFVSTAAHDLRSPASSVAMLVQLLRMETLSQQGDEVVERMSAQCQRMMSTLESRLARVDGTEPIRTGSCASVVHDVVSELESLLVESQLTITVTGDAAAEVPAGVIAVAVGAVVDNAIVHRHRDRPGEVAVTIGSGVGRVCIDIADTGPGIAEAILGHEYEPGIRGDAAVPGVGRGLSTARSAVEAFDGVMETVRSGSDGTAVRIDMPAARPTIVVGERRLGELPTV